jgi:hypothetical protein
VQDPTPEHALLLHAFAIFLFVAFLAILAKPASKRSALMEIRHSSPKEGRYRARCVLNVKSVAFALVIEWLVLVVNLAFAGRSSIRWLPSPWSPLSHVSASWSSRSPPRCRLPSDRLARSFPYPDHSSRTLSIRPRDGNPRCDVIVRCLPNNQQTPYLSPSMTKLRRADSYSRKQNGRITRRIPSVPWMFARNIDPGVFNAILGFIPEIV